MQRGVAARFLPRRGRGHRFPPVRHHPSAPRPGSLCDQRRGHAPCAGGRHRGGRAPGDRHLVEQPGRLQPEPGSRLRRERSLQPIHALRPLEEADGGRDRRGVGGRKDRDGHAPSVLVLRTRSAATPDALLHHDQGGQGADRGGRRVTALDVVRRQHLPGAAPRREERGGTRADVLGRRSPALHHE